jgi:hypothetical protein
MSRSYRRPWQAVTGRTSAARDKITAARGVRRRQNQWLFQLAKQPLEVVEQAALVPHRRECAWNDVWSWKRDGTQHYAVPAHQSWSDYRRVEQGLWAYPAEQQEYRAGRLTNQWPPQWFFKLKRK